MTTQIAVRLPDDAVEFLDTEIRAGRAKSRADLLARLIAREQRRARDADDIRKILEYRALHGPDDLDDLVAYASRTPLDLD